MAVVAGIDEAGYGPLLGPLVVSATAFSVPDDRLETDLWQLIGAANGQQRSRDPDALRVADSKALYNRPADLGKLENNLLPFAGLLGPVPKRSRGFVSALCAGAAPDLSPYPWYRERDTALPRRAEPKSISERTERLRERLARCETEFRVVRVHVLDVTTFNRDVTECDNKSIPLARRVASLMTNLWERFGKEEVRLYADKLGGRKRYASILRATFGQARVTTRVESAERSEYTISDGTRHMQVSFEAKADRRHFPTALASMFSKYTRELFVEMLNDFWLQRVPGLRPTAGYVPDGRRFLRAIEATRRAEQIPLNLLQRCR